VRVKRVAVLDDEVEWLNDRSGIDLADIERELHEWDTISLEAADLILCGVQSSDAVNACSRR
jgi:electron transfer flavoprotein alpha/beta subunit